MKKFFVFAIALVSSALVLTACNSNDPQHPIKGVKFVCDYDRGETPVREYFYFGNGDDFEWGWEIYADQARTQRTERQVDYGTYTLNEADHYIDLAYTGGFYETKDGKQDTGSSHKSERVFYELKGDTIKLTSENGYPIGTYWKK